MSKILISGCGITWSKQERPSWAKVLRVCGVDIDDRAGPAISNQLILDNMIDAVMENEYSQAVCQLTDVGKLDVELNSDDRREIMKKDPIRNFSFQNIWPSSSSQDHESKRLYYKYLYSPGIEQKNILHKWLLLKILCLEKDITLHTILGYKINWIGEDYKLIETNHDWQIYEDYKTSSHWQSHDHTVGEKNTVPNKHYQIALAKKINKEFLKLPIEDKLEKFYV